MTRLITIASLVLVGCASDADRCMDTLSAAGVAPQTITYELALKCCDNVSGLFGGDEEYCIAELWATKEGQR